MEKRQIGIIEAKNHFSQILKNVEQGASFIITKRGIPVAMIVPFNEEPNMPFKKAAEQTHGNS